ncbi:uncharacterized protein BXZ73DRAFT_105899 [Epithele typhae]|uniref:uncharacterized protein n=1 Tax=Epithele typhae TaxID=378194 RepID=UPI002008DC3F|nr:uncharacterized protein BXZ73DRAFT_105899 [Epithele typhae]KAH9916270.1 hypothetical protein BXZ73DRAFT_105899 [Epithele typhae]
MTKSNSRIVIQAKSALARITLTHHTLAFFLLSVIHCLAQGLTAAFLYSEDASSSAFINTVISTAKVPPNEVARLFRNGDDLTLKMCTAAPVGDVYKSCETLWSTDMGASNSSLAGRFLSEQPGSVLTRRGPQDSSIQAVADPITGNVSSILLIFDNGNQQEALSTSCVRTLEYPARILDNSRREDLALVGSQFWLLAISTFGILYNSIPHIWAIVFARFLQTAWAAYTLWRTTDVQFRYNTLVTGPTTFCHFDVLPQYFITRIALQIPELILNFTAWASTSWLAWRIVKGYKNSTIRRVLPPPGVMRLYRFFLIGSMFHQLSFFFTVTAVSLWIDQLRTSSLAYLAEKAPLYYALFVFTIVTIVPWIICGWYAVRREKKLLMGISVFLNVAYVVCWSTMFDAPVYQWTFIEWPFFACMLMVATFCLIGAGVFAVISWVNFGKGLAHYLHVEAVLTESDFDPDVFANDSEKGPDSGNPMTRSPSSLSQLSLDGAVIKKDSNWDFADIDRPAIYTVDLATRK